MNSDRTQTCHITHHLSITHRQRTTRSSSSIFFFNGPATTEFYTLSLHDALPISLGTSRVAHIPWGHPEGDAGAEGGDRKSTRLNSSHPSISYAVFCLKKKIRNPITISARSFCRTFCIASLRMLVYTAEPRTVNAN